MRLRSGYAVVMGSFCGLVAPVLALLVLGLPDVAYVICLLAIVIAFALGVARRRRVTVLDDSGVCIHGWWTIREIPLASIEAVVGGGRWSWGARSPTYKCLQVRLKAATDTVTLIDSSCTPGRNRRRMLTRVAAWAEAHGIAFDPEDLTR